MGAVVAARLAIDHPETIQKLVLATPAVIRSRYSEWLYETLLLLHEHVSPDKYVRIMMTLAFAPSFFEKGYAMIKEVGKMLTPTDKDFRQIRIQLSCLKDVDISSELSTIKAATLIIAGERDVLAPIEGARKLASKLRGSRLFTLPEAGHSPFVESTEQVMKVLEDFL